MPRTTGIDLKTNGMHPKGMPKDIISKLNAARCEGTVRSRLADLGIKVFPREQQTPQALRGLQMAEIEKWWPIINEAGIEAE